MASRALPKTYKQLFGHKFSSNFREATELKEVPLAEPKPGQLLIRNRFIGVNASDINHTAGRYDPTLKPPYPVGMEAVGEVVGLGEGCHAGRLNQAVLFMAYGAYSEYCVCTVYVDHKRAFPVKSADSRYIPLLVSGLTAAMCLEKACRIKPSDKVLVTAAAGGTGQLAVQLAKNHGCHVIGTCSTKEKAEHLKSIGCNRPVIYTEENLMSVLKQEYPDGVDAVYETIGGEMFATCLKNLATFGRLAIVGSISDYQQDGQQLLTSDSKIYEKLTAIVLSRSASITGYFLFNHFPELPQYLPGLIDMYHKGQLKMAIDQGQGSSNGPFIGLDKVADAIEYLYKKKNVGKVVVEVNPETAKL